MHLALALAFALVTTALCGCGKARPDSDCETGTDCVLIPIEDKCSEAAQCFCGPERVAGNERDADEFNSRYEAAVCLPSPCCNGEALCQLREEILFCDDGRCGVVFGDETPPAGADIKQE